MRAEKRFMNRSISEGHDRIGSTFDRQTRSPK